MAMQKATIGTLMVVAVMSVVLSAFGALVATQRITNTGNITAIGVGVYSDSACTNVLSSIGWGTLNPGTATNYTLYVKNNGNIPVTLTMTTGNWTPASASSNITLAWNRQNYALSSGAVVQAVLTLTVASGISGITDFSFDITITGTQ